MSFTVIDLSQLPLPDVVETLNYEQLMAELLADLRARHPDFSALVESDPAFKVLEVCAYRELLLRARINAGARAVMLPSATGADLDQLGSYWGIRRLIVDAGDPDAIPPRELVLEDDVSLRARIQLSMEGQTNAGTEGAYLSKALAADGRVKSVAAKSPTAGEVVVTVLSHEGNGSASTELVQTVGNYLRQPHIRQMTDALTVQSADIVSYRVKATLFINPGPGADQVMTAARDAVTAYVEGLHKIGFLVPISGIYGALQQPGVVRVELTEPAADVAISDVQAGFCSAIELTQGAA
ncbi:baseplate assembly protein [Candidatus Sororendozoicomonas aggregata]|uniref:baseplate assembly protein n=1 Tax=Candidatus Sororendozoicomonas aggregata TaxID=3073239 RepID=UPI002ED14327